MGDKTKIEWTDASWNPITGCTKVSQGCKNCYALRHWPRLSANPKTVYYGRKFTDVKFHEEKLYQPLYWRKPRMVFVNSMGDLFHEYVPDKFIDYIWVIMSQAKQHTFQILTKRPDRMHDYIINRTKDGWREDWGNIWLGVSVEDQATANERIPTLLDTPAMIRFISAEPMLGPITLGIGPPDSEMPVNWLTGYDDCYPSIPGLDWVVVGGESGPGARPTHPAWVRSLRDQCQTEGTPFFFKQWGTWLPGDGEIIFDVIWQNGPGRLDREAKVQCLAGSWYAKVGKTAAGRKLDGRTWDEMP